MAVRRSSGVFIVVDLLIIWFSSLTAYVLRSNGGIPGDDIPQFAEYSFYSSVLCLIIMLSMGLYRNMWQYASVRDLAKMCYAVFLGWGTSYLLSLLLLSPDVPIGIAVRTLETELLLMGGVRAVWRLVHNRRNYRPTYKANTLIYGAGNCGMMVAREIMDSAISDLRIVGFIDDDPLKHRLRAFNLPVLGDRHSIDTIVKDHMVGEIIVAIPSAPKQQISEILNHCVAAGVKVKIIPSMRDLITGRATVNAIRDVNVEDLLGRDPVETDLVGIAEYVEDKVVLVTGAGGSIGSELCRQIAPFQPAKLLLLGHGENSIYTIEMEMKRLAPHLQIIPIIADIQDRQRLEAVFEKHRPNVVFHAAAHKHVPLMEKNPSEAVKNNVFGTQNVADCADRYGADRFVLISSDKAVNPTSIMGATKRIAEMYIQSLNSQSKTKFAAVRFGNVLGSRGSVVPLFQKQIARGGPVTVTDPEMVRYFMTIPEAVQLVIQAGALSKGGEVFILDMGEPVSILQLAEKMIRLSGFEPYTDIDIQFTGMREGEKLYEELLTAEEGLTKTQNQRIFIGKPSLIDQRELDLEFARLERVLTGEVHEVKGAIEVLVPILENVS